ncbi:uncharacterized protein LOC131613979 [Vicia villosa]|uniref:uncharacterized protein LOC131613979 n=1 Tax=Vicia villosa TaxID=3911 RepID=UPI00273B56BA|nr:uncharacterized protein LOC131613979 [Vicia villosa]
MRDFVTVPVNRLLENCYITVSRDPYFRLRDKECRDVVGTCNGLVCLIGYSINKWTKFKRVWFRFWNPATRSISEKLGYFSYFDKNERKSVKFVFGYDNSADTYKVVMWRSGCESDPESKVSVKGFSLGDNGWRNIQSFPVMKEFGDEKSWTQFLKFSYNGVRMNYEFGRPLLKSMPLHLSENGDTVVLANNRQHRVILYNRRNNRARKTILNTKICWPSLKDYVESLVSTS